jgi:predicted choloylglycine hydrolase
MKSILSIILFVLFIFKTTITIACSLFHVSTPDTVIAGRNHDWFDEGSSLKYLIEFYPSATGRNGTFFNVANLMTMHLAFEGINDKGLFMGLAAVPKTTITNDNSKMLINGCGIIRNILEKCSTVDEAVDEFKKYSVYVDQSSPIGFPNHYMLADSSGKSAVIELVNSEIRVMKKKGNFQCMTNAYLSEVKCDDVPFWAKDNRYNILISCLENNNKVNINDSLSILSKVAQTMPFSCTQTSIVYDLKNKIITIVWQRQYDKRIIINLEEELKKGEQVKEISSLK